MKYKCTICEKEKESNDCILEIQINLSEVYGKKLGDYVHSPIYSEKICSNCAKFIVLIFKRGMEKIKEMEKKSCS